MEVVIKRRVCAEPLFDHLPGFIVADRVGIRGWRTAQVAAETAKPARLVMAIVDCPARGVGHGLDVAGQIVSLLNEKSGSPITPTPTTSEVLPSDEWAPKRVVALN